LYVGIIFYFIKGDLMNNQFIEARELLLKARESLRRGDKTSARQLGERAARLAPQMEDVWLVLAASDPDPQDALAYAQKALRINPQSTRAQRAVEWATGRLKQVEALKALTPVSPLPRRAEAAVPQEQRAYQTAVAMPMLKVQGRNWLLPALLVGGGILFIGFVVLFLVASPVLASVVNSIGVAAPTQENLWAPADIAKPEVTPIDVSAFAAQAENTPVPTFVPTLRATLTPPPTSEATEAPTDAPTESSTVIPADTEAPGVVAMELIEDTPTNEYKPPTPGITVGDGERWIDVDLTNQMVYAYEGDVIVNSFLVSTGTWLTPTVTGEYKIYVKYRSGSMTGPGYHLTNVPYIMYFYKSYGLHGTYWHNNFGTPMSHGCVNLRTDEAAWLFDWASVGTVVNVHY
jgi:lipoprotein-anchoring transpeptidase ErfK/SrfK